MIDLRKKIKQFLSFLWIKKLYFAFINLFRKRRIRETVEHIKEFPHEIKFEKIEVDPQKWNKYITSKKKLDDCFFGTLVDRKPSDGGMRKKKHLHDGWREGFSHPFEWEGKVYDVQEDIDKSVDLYNELHSLIQAKYLGG